MPKQSAFDAFCEFSQSERAVPISPAHELAGAGAGAVLAAGASVDTAGVSANNGAAKINDVAHAIALSLQGFINPPFVKRTRCDARPMQSTSAARSRVRRARLMLNSRMEIDALRTLAAVEHRIRIGIDLTARCAVAIHD